MDSAFQFRALEDMLRSMNQRVAQLERRSTSSRLFQGTPNLRGSTTDPNIGTTGLRYGDYQILNGRCFWRAIITFGGAGISAGSGNLGLELPTPPFCDPIVVGFAQIGQGWWYANTYGFVNVSMDITALAPLTARLVYDGGFVTAAAPGAPGNGSVLSVQGDFPVA